MGFRSLVEGGMLATWMNGELRSDIKKQKLLSESGIVESCIHYFFLIKRVSNLANISPVCDKAKTPIL